MVVTTTIKQVQTKLESSCAWSGMWQGWFPFVGGVRGSEHSSWWGIMKCATQPKHFLKQRQPTCQHIHQNTSMGSRSWRLVGSASHNHSFKHQRQGSSQDQCHQWRESLQRPVGMKGTSSPPSQQHQRRGVGQFHTKQTTRWRNSLLVTDSWETAFPPSVE